MLIYANENVHMKVCTLRGREVGMIKEDLISLLALENEYIDIGTPARISTNLGSRGWFGLMEVGIVKVLRHNAT